MFTFVSENINEDIEVLEFQYKVLLVLGSIDEDGNQFIRPTNEECEPLREYARNCVTQSNSKKARENRLELFNSILKNTDYERNENLSDILKFLANIYGEDKIGLKKIGDYQLLDTDKLH